MQYLDFRFWNLTGFNQEEKKQHKDAVYFALENAEDFEIVSWYGSKRDTSGKIRIIFSHPINAGYCRDYQVQLQINKKIRSKTLTACKYIGGASWSFNYYANPEDKKFFN
jgi:surface antigen